MSTQILKYLVLLILLFFSVKISAHLQVEEEENYANTKIKNTPSIGNVNSELIKKNTREIYEDSFDVELLELNLEARVEKDFNDSKKRDPSDDIGGVEILELIM